MNNDGPGPTPLPNRAELLQLHGTTRTGLILQVGFDAIEHEASRAAVATLASFVRAVCPSAFIAQVGGSEIAALFVEETNESAVVAAAKQIKACAEPDFTALRLTLSLAVVEVAWYGGLDRALRAADSAMQHARNAGGNQVMAAVVRRPGIDALTGLLNRPAFDEAYKKARRHDAEGFAVVYLDLDSFKLVNDSRGHDFGDVVLVAVANALNRSKKLSSVARYGADEFAAIAPTGAYGLDRVAAEVHGALIEAQGLFREQLQDLLGQVFPTYLGPARPPLGISLAAVWVPPGVQYGERAVFEVADDMLHAIRSLSGTGYMSLRLPIPID